MVLFPQPDSPTSAIFFPASNNKFKFSKIKLSFSSDEYLKFTFLKYIFPLIKDLFGSSVESWKSKGIFLSQRIK